MDKIIVEDWMAKYLPWAIFVFGALLGIIAKEYAIALIIWLVAMCFDLQFQINRLKRNL
jgi:uncharacterized membrane protein YoaK (UPF0700 family)